jgi:hypothetical protein
VLVSPLPDSVRRLFWDTDPDTVDLDRHADYVMERIMSRGTLDAMHWLRRTYSVERMANFLRRKAHRLSPRDRAYWCLVAGVEDVYSAGGATPPWNR